MNKEEFLKTKADEAYDKALEEDYIEATEAWTKASEEVAYKKKHDPTNPLKVELDILVGTAKDIEDSLEEFRESLKRLESNIEKSNFLKSS